MTSRDFVYWLQGFFEISETNTLTERQVKMIKAHLNLVFKHEIDPSNLEGLSPEEVAEYVAIHSGAKDGDRLSVEEIIEKLGTQYQPIEVKLNC
jgi:hypothetical protein